MKLLLAISLIILLAYPVKAQEGMHCKEILQQAATKSAVIEIPCIGLIHPAQSYQAFEPILTAEQFPNPEGGLDSLQLAKQVLTRNKLSVAPKANEENELIQGKRIRAGLQIGRQFEGNTGNNGCPPDNTIAISNGGQIISVVNGSLFHFNEYGVYQNAWSLPNFINSPGLTPNVCDPKVLYDNEQDRFVMFAQTCDGSMSEIILCFSQSNNPSGGWWVYRFFGDPAGFGRMFDYPKMAFTANELIVTGNLFAGSSFSEAMIFQFPKANGYNGVSLPSQYWYNIQGSPSTILPLRYGISGNYGNGIYLVSTVSPGNNAFNLYHLTDQMSATNEQLIYNSIGTDPYSAAGNAYQAGSTHVVNSGDCRALDGFYLNGVAHFVHHTNDAGWSAIRYNRYNISAGNGTYSTITNSGTKDYCYPAVSSTSNSSSDQSSVVSFLASGPSSYPEIRAKSFDNSFGTSTSILVKGGNGPVYTCYDPGKASDRWGDYSGSAKRYNSSSSQVWINGCYGNHTGGWNTYIAELNSAPTAIEPTVKLHSVFNLFPNPVQEKISIQFIHDRSEKLSFTIIDAAGKEIAEVYSGYVEGGMNTLSFNISSLSNGNYFLCIKNERQRIKSEKFSVNR